MDQRSLRRTKLRTVLVICVGVGLVALTVFKVPLATILVVGLLLVCPLMMTGVHGGSHRGVDTRASGPDDRAG